MWFQFLKRDTSSERLSLEKLDNITLVKGYDKIKFTFAMTEEEKYEATKFYNDTLEDIKELVNTGDYDMLVLDETFGAISSGILSEDFSKK